MMGLDDYIQLLPETEMMAQEDVAAVLIKLFEDAVEVIRNEYDRGYQDGCEHGND
jgi:hypothetical protein